MGILRMGPPEELVLLIKKNLNASIFIETGTFEGGTTIWAANFFEKVITIEQAKVLYEKVSEKYKHVENINFLFGNSKNVLRKILPEIREPAIFWLDAHWCSLDSYGENDQCPIIEELNVISASGIDHSIIIDDARLFLSPPPLPNIIEQWPSVDQIIKALQGGHSSHYIVVFEDVIIAVPNQIKNIVAGYLQEQSTRTWQEQGVVNSDKKSFLPDARTTLRKLGNKLGIG